MAWDVFYLQDTRKWFPNSAMVFLQVHRGVHVRISASELQRTRICLGPSMQQVSGNTLPVLEPKLMSLFTYYNSTMHTEPGTEDEGSTTPRKV